MSTTSSLVSTPTASKPIPRIGLWSLLRRLASPMSERVDMLGRLREAYDAHGPVSRHELGFVTMVNLLGPDANRFVLLDKERLFSARKPWMQIMGRIFPNGLLLMDGEEHRRSRSIIHTAFKRRVLCDYAARMSPMLGDGVAEWGTGERTRVGVFAAVKELTLAAAARIFVGAELGADTRAMNRAFEAMVAASMSRLRLPIPGLEFHAGLEGRKYLVDYFGGMIAAKRAGDEPDVFARLCRSTSEEGERFDDQQIVDHMSFLMMAAHDTTTSTLCSMMYELARHPDWQERVRAECAARDREHLEWDDLEALEVTGRVMKETLRRYPPLPVIPRIAERETTFEGYRIPAGAMVVVSPIFTHHMPEWWSEPERFDPDRFAPGRAEDERHTHSWIPFGGGVHMCVGLRFAEVQVKLVMHHLVRRYRWRVPDGYAMPVQQAPISKPMDGLPVELERLR